MNFESMSLSDLKAYAKEHNIKGVTALRKNELIERLNSEFKKENIEQSVPSSEEKNKVSLSTVESVEQPESVSENESSAEAKKEYGEGYRIIRAQNVQGEQRSVGNVIASQRSASSGIDIARGSVQYRFSDSQSGYQPRFTGNIQNGQNSYPQNNQSGYQPRFAGNVQNGQGSYPQNSQSGYQPRFVGNVQNGQNSYPQNNQSGYQPRFAGNVQNGQNSYPQNNQSGYQSRFAGNVQNGQNAYTQRFSPDSANYYPPRAQENVSSNEWNKPVQEPRQSYQPQNAGETQNFGQNNTPVSEPVNERVLLDTGISREGVLELVKSEGYGFLRCDNYLPGDEDVYVSPTQIRRFNLKTGDLVKGNLREKNVGDKFQGLAFVEAVNGEPTEVALKRPKFEDLTPVFPHERIHFETPKCTPAMRLVDILSPVGKGQRGMIVSQPKAGKTTLLKQIANSIIENHPEIKIIILLIDERPEEVTDIKESIVSDNVEVIYSTFDELPENHKRVSEMVIERGKRLVEHGKDVCILLDSITRLARAYNITVTNSGRTLSGGLDPSALYMPKKFFGAARCMREGGSLTILATALVDTGSRMDDVVFEEFKGTGNMELVLDRSLSEKRIFPAIDLPKSGTRREDLLLSQEEMEASFLMRNALNGAKSEEAIEVILNYLRNTGSNKELVNMIRTRGIFVK